MKEAETTVKNRIRALLLEAGASAVGFAAAGATSAAAWGEFEAWIDGRRHEPLGYMTNYPALRRNPALLLEGARTVVATAWNYNPPGGPMPRVARYARGRDYHKALRSLLREPVRRIEALTGGASRLCIDSAPMMERYWALQSGIAFRGRNGCVIVPGVGSWVVLAEILLTASLEPDAPLEEECLGCGACLKACPTGALRADGTLEARLCLSAATVEGGPLPEEIRGDVPLLGCDRCQEVCPHNRGAAVSGWVKPLDLSWLPRIGEMSEEEFEAVSRGTAFRRPGLAVLQRNLRENARRRKSRR